MNTLPPRARTSVRPLAPAVVVATLSFLVGGMLPAGPVSDARTANAVASAAASAATTASAAAPATAASAAATDVAAPTTLAAETSGTSHAAPVRGERVHTVPLGGIDPAAVQQGAAADLDAEQATRLAALSAPVEGQAFTVAAAAWDAQAGAGIASVQIRVRQGGEWSDWQELERTVLDEDFAVDRLGTDPFVAFDADGAQLRVFTADGTVPAGLALSLIDPGTAATDDDVAAPSPASATPGPAPADVTPGATPDGEGADADLPRARTASARTATGEAPVPHTVASVRSAADARRKILPHVITRAQWGANESWASPSVQAPMIRALAIHHTAGTNTYTRAQAVEQMRGIYAYYTKTLKWGDFPYHLVTDRFGNIYEGRRGALDARPVGTHVGGFNTGTAGISTLGDYATTTPPEAVVDAMARATAFYLYRDGIDAYGQVTLTPGGSSRYGTGGKVTFDTIFPHRAASLTDCPGRYLTARLGDIRSRAAAIASQARGTTPAPPSTPASPSAPTPPSAPSTTPAPRPGGGTYTVRNGDGWSVIAHRTGVPMRTLQQLNGMSPRTLLHPGMVLRTTAASAPATRPPAAAPSRTYTVRNNDGWSVIAQRTGVPMRTLQRLNGMSPRTLLHPGMVLRTR